MLYILVLILSKIKLDTLYINKENFYADEYLYVLKMYSDFISKLDEKLEFLLENIDIYQNENMQYIERKWHHSFILNKTLFNISIN